MIINAIDGIICFMNLSAYSDFNCEGFSVELGQFRSILGRFYCFKVLIQKILSLPFALFFRSVVTIFRIFGFFLGTLSFIGSLGRSRRTQEFLSRRGSFLAKDLADWMVFPFVVTMGLIRLLLGFVLHPMFYFH